DDAAFAADADIVVEKIDPPVAVDHGLDELLALGFPGGIAGERRGGAAFGRDHVDGSLRQRQLAAGHHQLGSGARQQHRRRAAIADAISRGAAARDQRNLAGETGIVLWAYHRFHPCFPETIARRLGGRRALTLRQAHGLSAWWHIEIAGCALTERPRTITRTGPGLARIYLLTPTRGLLLRSPPSAPRCDACAAGRHRWQAGYTWRSAESGRPPRCARESPCPH